MLIHQFDRAWSPALLYLLIVTASWLLLGQDEAFTFWTVFTATSALFARILVSIIRDDCKIHSLGSYASYLPTRSPFNIGFIVQAVHHYNRHENHVFWHKMFRHCSGKLGMSTWTVETRLIGERIIFTADEENIKAILATQFQDYGKGDQFRKDWKDFLGLSIFTTDGEMWHNSRSLIRPQFIKDRVSDLDTFEKHMQVLLPMLTGAHDGATVRIDDVFLRLTLDVATEFLLGTSTDSLQRGRTDFSEAFAMVQNFQGTLVRMGPAAKLLPRKKFNQSMKVINEFVEHYIDLALQLAPEELEKTSKSDEGYTFLHALAAYTRDRNVLRDQLVAVLLAGRDTTAMGLSWLFYEISKQPKIVTKLREEIERHVEWGRQPTYADLKAMRYLQHTINETLRLYPIVPYNVRIALRDTTLPRGGGPTGDDPVGIPKDTPIGYSTYILQQRSDTYPSISPSFPDPKSFSPERWDHWTPKSWTYIPFNGGPRICIGQQFALTEMAYIVVRILQTFERIEARDEGFPGLKTDIVIQPARGVHVGFFKGGAR